MQKKPLEKLNVLDDFLFNRIVSTPEIGPEFCSSILRIILNREIRNLRVIPQCVYYGSDSDRHGARLDVYIEEDGSARAESSTVFDIEPDQSGSEKLILALPKRVRFYHAMIDGTSLKSGEDYSCLKRVAVIMITPYDPFGLNRMMYTIKNGCAEEPDMSYDDGAVTLFLYTRGDRGNPPEELKKLLHYLEESKEENAQDDAIRNIHRMVQEVKQSKEVSIEYMKIFEREQMIREDGIKEGREKERERLLNLISCLIKDNRIFDIERLKEDEALREKLYEEYQL